MSFGSFVRAYVYALCVSRAVNTRGFVWMCLGARYKFSFIHLCGQAENLRYV